MTAPTGLRLERPTGVYPSTAQLLFAAGVAACLATRLGAPLRFGYPAAAAIVGLYLVRLSPGAYIGFTMWLWFLSPLVRRLADYSAGWYDPSPILLAPYLVTGLSALPLIGRITAPSPSTSPLRDRFPLHFVLAAAGVSYGLLVGLVLNPVSGVIMELLNWIVPLIFGWYIALYVDCRSIFQRAVGTTFHWGLLVMGVYGIYQFIVCPPWDAAWLTNVGADSMGIPEPYGLRVFSTMHSPAIFALTLAIGIGLWLSNPRFWTLFGAALALVAVLLSQVRVAWLVLAFTIVLMVPSLGAKLLTRVVAFTGLLAILAAALLTVEPMRTVVSDRVATLSSLSKDESAQSRMEAHEYIFEQVLHQPSGYGLGAPDNTLGKFVMLRDSVVTSTLMQLGFVGSALYVAGLLFAVKMLWLAYRRRNSQFGAAASSTGIALIMFIYLSSSTIGPVGAFFWMLVGLSTSTKPLNGAPPQPGVAISYL